MEKWLAHGLSQERWKNTPKTGLAGEASTSH